jgi:PAP2 superfamily
MHLLALLTNPAIIGTVALFLSVVWMLRDEKDKTRPMLVFALTLNLFFGFLLTIFMSREGGLLPWKFDHVLAAIDQALGITAASIARPLQGVWRIPLIVIYQSMVPMMICWFFVTRVRNPRGSVVLAYVGELIAGPLLYALFPACGPIYAFGAQWLNPPHVLAGAIKLVGMPNAFPSLHVATALVFVLLAPGKLSRAISLAFLACTGMATLSTGEHYVIDLVAGLAFGCFAASVGYGRVRSALLYLGAVLGWSLAVRFGYGFLIAHPLLLRSFAVLTVAAAAGAVYKEWSVQNIRVAEPAAAVS